MSHYAGLGEHEAIDRYRRMREYAPAILGSGMAKFKPEARQESAVSALDHWQGHLDEVRVQIGPSPSADTAAFLDLEQGRINQYRGEWSA